ncbi:MBL fold metallo-hydrolase [Haloplanus aerogenes]|uniref:Glyoxylase-like metal-dependent hydrolase (Beta-lactamase superfamily II) n=1 Tax=Haloplanus aerogenes TaxID=660522 RepID=A0A3M0DWJ6_9EURY|nr:MBL fold metallo-hydrolase [Haloplanus aerogenes]AZH24549.1 MBL fold metallo-hydrolase [Haloplanus aerogenes]RMB23796.1 glyoxylase-like metal-dependent hydrolase (beta-lactamase superfamily II) [Haloplanus aerogenes]
MATDTERAGQVTPTELRRRLAAGDPLTLLDVRDRTEIERWRIEAPNYHHVPYMKFVAAGVTGDVADLLPADVRELVVVVCPRGEASAEVADQLVDAGVDARNLAGGMEAWARLYDRTVVWEDGATTVYQYHRPASGCLGYAIVSGAEMAVIDPLRAFTERYREDADELGATLTVAVDTHVHADHVSGVRALAAATGATPVLPQRAVERGVADGSDFETVTDGDELAIGDATLRAVALPGHTTGMTGFAVGEVLLTGDSVFLDGVARPDLQEDADPTEQARTLYATLTECLDAFDADTLIAPGHTDAGVDTAPRVARLGDLRERLAVFGMDEAAFVERVTQVGAEPANADRIVAINCGRESVDDETAFELELGPNNCSASG